jgi:DinB superfamily
MAETFEAYRNRVLSYLGDEEPIGVQQATPSQLERRLRDVAPEELIRRPAPEKWSIAEIVAHLADAELAMGWRLRNMLANPGVALTWWDEAVWAERLGYAQQEASLSAGVFRALRESNLRLLESVPRARWVECYGVHEVRGRQTVEEFVRLEAAHDLNHLRQIDRILRGCKTGQS